MFKKIKKGAYFFFLLGCISCKESLGPNIDFPVSPACGVDNPVEDLAWLRELTTPTESDNRAFFSVYQFSFEGKDYFNLGYCHPTIELVVIHPKRDCAGSPVELPDTAFQHAFSSQDEVFLHIWHGGECED